MVSNEDKSKSQDLGSFSLKSCNHIALRTKHLEESKKFYRDVLRFIPIKRPDESLPFDGYWLWKCGLSIHLLHPEKPIQNESNAENAQKTGGKSRESELAEKPISSTDSHIAFQCDNMKAAEQMLVKKCIKYISQELKDEKTGITVHQLFFHDPDGHTIELCDCENFPVEPLEGC